MTPQKMIRLSGLEPIPGKVLCIISGADGIVIGHNDRTITSDRWRKTMPDGAILLTRHAEEHALELAMKRKIGKIKSVLVLRYGRSGALRMSKPCHVCATKIANFYTGPVMFSNKDGEIETYV